MADCEFFHIVDWDMSTGEIYHAVCTEHNPTWPNCNQCQQKEEYSEDNMDTKDTLIDELVDTKDAILAALKWWDDDAKYMTEWVGDGETGDEQNVFDDDPEWVALARKAIADAPKPVPTTPPSPSDKVLLKTQLVKLTQGDVDILDGSCGRHVRIDNKEDAEVKRLYKIWKSL